MKKLLAAIDLSSSSATVIHHATTLASSLGAKLWLLHVADPDPDLVGYQVGPQTVRDAVSKELREEHRQLQNYADKIRADQLDCVALSVQGPTVDTILGEAQKLSVDMVIMGSHGKGVIKRLVLGSVCEGVLHNSNIPVLIIPTRDHT